MPTSTASAVWEGGLREGNGTYEAASGAFKGAYTVPTRFEGKPGSTPEELIAAAHAACISMALAAGLERAGTPPRRIATKAMCTLEKKDPGWRVTKMHLEIHGQVPGIDDAAFHQAAAAAKEGCPVSNALKGNVEITVEAKLD